MASNQDNKSAPSRSLVSKEDWQNLVSWEGEIYDTFFNGHIGFTTASEDHEGFTSDHGASAGATSDPQNVPSAPTPVLERPSAFDCPDTTTPAHHQSFTSDYHDPGSVASEQLYVPSTPASVLDGPSSFDYFVSPPPSIADGPSSYSQTFSWYSTSPAYSPAATSPFVHNSSLDTSHYGSLDASNRGSLNTSNQHSFGAWENVSPIHPLRSTIESPLLGAREHILPGNDNPLNSFPSASPYLVNGVQHAFNARDVHASQALSNLGVWTEQQPQTTEPIPEYGQTRAIPIYHPTSFAPAFSNNLPVVPVVPSSPYIPQQRNSARGNTVPQSSASPDTRRRPRPSVLSRSASISKPEPRRPRTSAAPPSPSLQSYGWVAYQPEPETAGSGSGNGNGRRLVPLRTDSGGGPVRRTRGRSGPLTPEQRKKAAEMRIIKVCGNCKKRKAPCDPGTPCRSCVERYKDDLVNHPCRPSLLSGLLRNEGEGE